jgi:hypothetical protein
MYAAREVLLTQRPVAILQGKLAQLEKKLTHSTSIFQ